MLARSVAIALLATSWALAPSASPAALCGDADGSGAVAINDVVRHLRVVSGIDAEAALCGGAGYADCGDLNGDGTGSTDISDTVLLLRGASNIANCGPDVCLPRTILAGCPGTATLPSRITGSLMVPAGCDARLNGVTYVEPGAILTVEAGATVKGNAGLTPPSLLVVRPGGRINAVGTATSPITWTSSNPPGMRAAEDWTGIMLLGRAPVNVPGANVFAISDASFGGDDAEDFSGCMAYNRIQFGGRVILPETLGFENHLSLYGVGSRTVLHHIHAHLGDVNCFEWGGGNVTASHLIASACADDAFSIFLGTTGGVQFALIAQRAENVMSSGSDAIDTFNSANHLASHHDNQPRTNTRLCNVTAIGARYSTANPGVTNQFGVMSRRGNAMTIANTIVKDFRGGGYQMRDAATAARACVDPTTLATTSPFGVIRNSLFTDSGPDGATHAVNHSSCNSPDECACTTTEHFALLQAQRAVLATTDPAVQGIGGHTFPPVALVPPAGSLPDTHPAADCTSVHPAFVDAPYIGAFEPGGDDWTAGWADYPPN